MGINRRKETQVVSCLQTNKETFVFSGFVVEYIRLFELVVGGNGLLSQRNQAEDMP